MRYYQAQMEAHPLHFSAAATWNLQFYAIDTVVYASTSFEGKSGQRSGCRCDAQRIRIVLLMDVNVAVM
jgi:hypothetical protein